MLFQRVSQQQPQLQIHSQCLKYRRFWVIWPQLSTVGFFTTNGVLGPWDQEATQRQLSKRGFPQSKSNHFISPRKSKKKNNCIRDETWDVAAFLKELPLWSHNRITIEIGGCGTPVSKVTAVAAACNCHCHQPDPEKFPAQNLHFLEDFFIKTKFCQSSNPSPWQLPAYMQGSWLGETMRPLAFCMTVLCPHACGLHRESLSPHKVTSTNYFNHNGNYLLNINRWKSWKWS